jgi:hypothetical protein
MSFTDQKQRIATEEDVKLAWGCGENGSRFRCTLCGHKFKVGDKYRWIYAMGRPITNPMVCELCDDKNTVVLDNWQSIVNEFKALTTVGKFWSLMPRE